MKRNIYLLFACLLMSHVAVAQCFPDRHSTNFFDGWVSCDVAVNPNPGRPAGHFIMYDFGKIFSLGQMHLWNSNDPAHLDWGMKDVAIDYSVDGNTWQSAGEFTIPQASGLSTYEGEAGPDLQSIEARYLLITAINNYGGPCFGLSEMHVEGEEVIISSVDDDQLLACMDISIFPNPFAEKMTLLMEPGCNGEARYTLFNTLGHQVWSEKSMMSSGDRKAVEIGKSIPAGSYVLQIEFGGRNIQQPVIKMGRS